MLQLVLLLWDLDAMHLGIPGPRDIVEEGHVTNIWVIQGMGGGLYGMGWLDS